MQWGLFLVALLPIIWLIFSLGVLKMAGSKACVIGLVLTVVLAIVAFKMPLVDSLTAALEGAVMGVWPIVYIIIAAVFTYNLTTASGSMATIRTGLSSITSDKRLLVLIIAWGFGGFLEAIAGFGTAVAIPASILIAFGVDPILSATICLIANTTPTAFGAIGLPVTTLAQISGLNVQHLSYLVAVQLLPLIVIIPFILVALIGGGIKAIKEVWMPTLAAGLAFGVPQIFVARFIGAELPAIIGSIICIIVTVWFALRYERKHPSAEATTTAAPKAKAFVLAAMPFILVFVFVMLASPLVPPLNHFLTSIKSELTIYTGAGASPYVFNWISTPGTLIILATIIGGLIQKMPLGEIFKILGKTARQMTQTLITVCAIVALAKVMGYSGMIAIIAATLVGVLGVFYPLIAPLIGALGTFVTGSDTSANVLFGGLQRQAASTLHDNTYWVVAANAVGATAGKMISPQSIAVASAATNLQGQEGTILKKSMTYFLGYLVVICAWIFLSGLFIHMLHI
ncbi:L-lactate permease [Loigolactobacillus coryniformis]|uniref:L-lactate permease n=1 Tax=Loigolactobacillus coryniformis TaxID=1610 RepID=UPI001C5DD896|nr:L-lactate permease [Loigolactobacillus coryniformis]MBW4801548.1 L-lactate permease [Loigolactobacillus coryniformis subsp. torquens]MBW4804249.1 L-lactate permease [Loigolactobacillus coryniformis subsp. torquens]